MSDETIRAALEAAAQTAYAAWCPPERCTAIAAAAIAAFLRALGSEVEQGRLHSPATGWLGVRDLAAAVERAAEARDA